MENDIDKHMIRMSKPKKQYLENGNNITSHTRRKEKQKNIRVLCKY